MQLYLSFTFCYGHSPINNGSHMDIKLGSVEKLLRTQVILQNETLSKKIFKKNTEVKRSMNKKLSNIQHSMSTWKEVLLITIVLKEVYSLELVSE